MTPTSLRAVTLKTVANYRQGAERAVGAYRLGGHRLIVALRHGVDSAARRSGQRFAPRMVAVVQQVGQQVGSLAAKALDAVSSRTSRVLEIGSDGLRSQVERVAELAGGLDHPVVAHGLRAAVRISLPGAQVALAVSERVAAGAVKLEAVAAGPGSSRANAVAQRERRAAAPARSTGKTAGKIAAKVDAEVKTASRRAAQAVGKTARQVSDDAAANAAAIAVAAAAASKAAKPKAARKPVAKPSAQAFKAVKAAQADGATASQPARRAIKKVAQPRLDMAKDAAEPIAA